MTHRSPNKLKGYLKPGGNMGGGDVGASVVEGEFLSDFELPALPDLTMFFFGGIQGKGIIDSLTKRDSVIWLAFSTSARQRFNIFSPHHQLPHILHGRR